MGYFILLLILIVFIQNLLKTPTNILINFFVIIFFLKFVFINIFSSVTGATGPFVVFLLVIVLIFSIAGLASISKQITRKFIQSIFVLLVCTLAYLIITASLKDISPINYISFVKYYYVGIPLLVYISINSTNINYNKVLKSIFIIFLIQATLGVLQYFLPLSYTEFFRIGSYEWNGETTYVTSISMWGGRQINGTLLHVGTYSNFMALLLVYFGGMYFFKTKVLFKSNLRFSLTLVFGLASLMIAGNRTSVISFIIGILIILFYYSKRLFTLAVAIAIPLFFLASVFYNSYVRSSTTPDIGYESPLERLSALGNIVVNFSDLSTSESLTLGRSFPLVDYFNENPLFGSGEFFKRGYNNELFAGTTIASWSDASLMFHIVEFGLIGFLLIIMPYLMLLRYIKKSCTRNGFAIAISIFITILIQTITDLGIFNILQIILVTSLLGIIAFSPIFKKTTNEFFSLHKNELE